MTFMNCLSQFNITNNNWFCNTSSPVTFFVPNSWNNVSLFNCCNSFNFPTFNFSNFNLFNNGFNWNNFFNWNTTFNWNNNTSWNNTLNWNNFTSFTNFNTTPAFGNYNLNSNRLNSTNAEQNRIFKSNHAYANLTRSEALNKAQNDSNLEKLTGGNGWSVSSSSFSNDIPYARKGTGTILSKVSNMIGENLTITSALGTKNSPHAKGNGYASHYNSSNPKLDIGGGLSPSKAYSLKTKLLNTGYFSRVEVETHGNTAHLDVQIKDSAFQKLDINA